MIDYTKFKSSLDNLILEHNKYENIDDYPEAMHKTIKNSVIHSFNICWDTLLNVTRRYLEEEGCNDIHHGGKPLIRQLNEMGFISSSSEQWFKYLDCRIATAHDYSDEKANDALDYIIDFIDDAIGSYQTMTGKTWQS